MKSFLKIGLFAALTVGLSSASVPAHLGSAGGRGIIVSRTFRTIPAPPPNPKSPRPPLG